MDQATVTAFIRAVVYGCSTILLMSVAWFLKRTLDTLSASIAELNKTLTAFGTTQARHDERISEHDRQLKGLWKGAACLNENCPIRQDGKP
jgi:hypothetical protein